MGAWVSHSELQQAVHRAEVRVGRIPIEGRYHRAPRCLGDDYLLTNQCLGTGYNGVVLLALNRHTGVKSAVKSFRLRGISKDVRDDLVSEVEIFLGMDHPHVARLTEVYESESTLSLVMEYLEGGELFDRLGEKGRFPEDEAAELTRQMLLAVNYLHSEGVAHRDLKLENWLFERKNENFLKLIDFGFSKIVTKDAKMDLGCGTISYQAPEVLNRSYTTQCDLWSLGVMVFTLLSGRMPFEGSSDREVARKIRGGNFSMQGRRWANISRMGKSFVQSLLVVRPEARLTAQQAQNHPWILERSRAASARMDVLDRSSIADAFCNFALESRFRQACLKLMAWSLGPDERGQVRDEFLRLDKSQTGAIKLSELKQVLEENFQMSQDDYAMVMEAFNAVTICSNGTFHYSDFLAAMMSSRITLRDALLQDTIRRFDVDGSGCITRKKLCQVLGRPAGVDEVFDELDSDRDGRVAPGDFIDYLSSSSRGRSGSDVGKASSTSSSDEQKPECKRRRHRASVWLGCLGGVRLVGKPALSRTASDC